MLAKDGVVNQPTSEDSTQNPAQPAEESPQVSAGDIENLLNEAQRGVDQAAGDPTAAEPFQLDDLQAAGDDQTVHPMALLSDVELDLRIELGRTRMRLEDVLRLRGGAVVALDKLAGDPVDIFVNGRLIARGEVLVMNENFCVRVTELLGNTA